MPNDNQQRKPRFRRVANLNFRLQARDIEIIRQVYKHRFLTSEQIKALTPGSNQVILRRLGLLYHNHYLDRPKEQIINYRAGSGSSPMVYGLGNQGALLLANEFNIPHAKVDWTSKNREVKTVFLEHTLLVANFMVCLELACRQTQGIKIIEPEEILAKQPTKGEKLKSLSFKVKIERQVKGEMRKLNFSIVPDQVFGLYFPQEKEGRQYAYFFLEVDRATMPVDRQDFFTSSYLKKLIGYWEAWEKEIFKKTFGFKGARVLTLTKSNERIKNMIAANKQVDARQHGSKMFLFTTLNNISLENPAKVLEPIWQNGRDSTLVSLLD